VATKQVNIDIIAKDKTRQAMQSATKGVNKLKDNVQQSVATQQKSFNALGNTVRNVIGGVIVFQALRFSKQMVDMASSVEEMQSKSSVVFGKFVNDVRGQLEKFGDTVGRSTFELEGMASSIQDTFVPMGFARKEASKLSVQLTKLAVDVASFNNASDTETMMAFQSALVGNHETVRRFGVVITEATLKQELLRMGITKNSKEVTNAEKVQARLNLIIAGTSDAQGDAERTNTSFANSMKALNAEFQEFMVQAITPMLPALSKMVQSLKNSITETKEFLRSIGLLNELNKVVPIVDHLAKNSDKLADAESRLAEQTKLLEAIQNKAFGAKLKDFISANSEFSLSILKGEKAVEARKKAIEKEIELIKISREIIVLEADARDLVTKSIEDQNKAQEKLTDAQIKAMDIDGFMSKRSQMLTSQMTGSEQLSGGINFDDKLAQTTKMFDFEIELQKNHLTKIMEQDELLAEQRRIVADDRITLAHETAQKEMEIQKKLFDDNFNLIKSGKAGEINLEKMSGKSKSELAVKVGREGLAQLAQNNKKAFAINKAFAMAEAIINTARGVAQALPNIPLAIAIGVFGALQVATIAQQKYQGRKQGGRMNQGQPYLVGEAGAELVVPDRASNVVPNGQLGGMGKPVTVNFNISTVDAKGFNELLVNSRGTIVNLINSAVNEKGRMAII